jgi:ketosteroid isomerase-like protein
LVLRTPRGARRIAITANQALVAAVNEGKVMISLTQAQTFAQEWVDAWNSHDLDRILSHYADDFQMTSPFIVTMMDEPTGTIKGREKVRAYWAKALERLPDLHFDLIEVLASVDSITVYYHAILGKRAVEVFFLDENGKVRRGIAHYNS